MRASYNQYVIPGAGDFARWWRSRPIKFALTHFFNPVLYTQMVEVVKGDMEATSFDTVVSFLKRLGREPVETKDISGFVSNSILMYYAVMALQLVQCGARIEDVDQAAKELWATSAVH